MALGSHYGSSTRKQLVRPFLSSPITLFAYLILVLTGIGLLEWVLRVSTSVQPTHDLAARAAWLERYYSQLDSLSKHTVSDSRSTTRRVGLLRRQSGELETPHDEPTSTTPVFPETETETITTTTTTPVYTTTTSRAATTTSSSTKPATTTSSTAQSTTTSSTAERTTTTSTTERTTTTTAERTTTTSSTTGFTTTTSSADVSTTTTSRGPAETTSSSSSTSRFTTTTPNADESTTTTSRGPAETTPSSSSTTRAITTTTPSLTTPITLSTPSISAAPPPSTSSPGRNDIVIVTTTTPSSLASTTPSNSPIPQPDTSITTTLSISTPPTTSLVFSNPTTSSISRPPTTLSTNSVPTAPVSSDSETPTPSPSSSVPPQLLLSSSSPSISSPSSSDIISTPSSIPSSSGTIDTTLALVISSASIQPEVAVQTTNSPSSSSVISIADKASTSFSQSTIVASIVATSTDSAIATPTAIAAAATTTTCRRGFSCLFAHKSEAMRLADGYKTLTLTISPTTEFAATFVSMIIILLFQSFWLIIYASIRLNEPFHQLAQPRQTPLDTSLLFEFLVVGFPLDHFRAGFGGNWTSWYMVTAYAVLVIMLVAPSLAAEAFSIQNVKVYCGTGSSTNDCVKRVWTVAPGPVRALQVLLVLAAVLVFVVLVARSYRGSALSLKKVNLALIASTLNDSETTSLLHDVNPDAPLEEAIPLLQTRSWALEPSIASEIGTEHASYILRNRPNDNAPAQQVRSAYAEQSSSKKRDGPPRPWLNLFLPASIILFLLVLLITYTINGPDDSRLTFFFATATFGPKFILVSVATILGIALSRVENEVRVLTPYRALRDTSNPQPLLMRRLHPSALTQAFAAARNGEWTSAFISFMAGYGANVLAIAISNIPFHPGRSVAVTIACIFISLGLLVLMAGSLVAVAVWRRGNSSLPLQSWPVTLADIYVLMVHSRIPGVRGVEGNSNDNGNDLNVTEFYGETMHGKKKPVVTQRTVEVEE